MSKSLVSQGNGLQDLSIRQDKEDSALISPETCAEELEACPLCGRQSYNPGRISETREEAASRSKELFLNTGGEMA